jgi:isoamylase
MSGSNLRVEPGEAGPLGAVWDGRGVNFALFSEAAEKVELCLFDSPAGRELNRIVLPARSDDVFHGYVRGLKPGQLYGYRVYGPYAPERGLRFNHHKLLIDPYARALQGAINWSDAVYGYTVGHPDGDLSFDERDSAPDIPKCQVVDPRFDWSPILPPLVPWRDTVIYETHVKGFTQRHPGVPKRLRGTFAGFAQVECIRHLKGLGVTSLELLPIQAFARDHDFVKRGLTNYWGYSTLGFFAPDGAYLGGDLSEMKAFVAALHDAGIEVILDVVYNHTAEGDQKGPTLCFRGIDNAAYYRLDPGQPRLYENATGCGNTLRVAHPRVLDLVVDSLRYWVTDFRVDGFRFDLGATLLRGADGGIDPQSTFLERLRADPALANVKLIAEPWDVGPEGHQLGSFGSPWAEWNDRYRDTVRRFWTGESGLIGELATRLMGSSDVFARTGRGPLASINFVTAHDGFTLKDLVSYARKHNGGNGEDNKDGTDNNFSWNCGAEGPSDDPVVLALRRRQTRNLLTTLVLSQGIPMLNGGDEFGRSQNGNNNAYCHDDESNWYDWEGIDDDGRRLTDFVRFLLAFRRAHPVFRRSRFFTGTTPAGGTRPDVTWLRRDGLEKIEADWLALGAKSLCYVLSGESAEPPDDTFLVMISANDEPTPYHLPAFAEGGWWEAVIDTRREDGRGDGKAHGYGSPFPLAPRSVMVFILRGTGT